MYELVYVVYKFLDQLGNIFARSLDVGLYHIVKQKSILKVLSSTHAVPKSPCFYMFEVCLIPVVIYVSKAIIFHIFVFFIRRYLNNLLIIITAATIITTAPGMI